MDKFTASNGVEVHREDQGSLTISPRHGFMRLADDEAQALGEFFLHERDQELGRWRFNAYLTVYEAENHQPGNRARAVNVLDERTGRLHMRHEGQAAWRETNPALSEAAAAYFAAHPEPKPWHDAKHLEIWALTIEGCPPEAYVYRNRLHPWVPGFRPVANEERVRFAKDDPRIRAAHRLWPEVSDD